VKRRGYKDMQMVYILVPISVQGYYNIGEEYEFNNHHSSLESALATAKKVKAEYRSISHFEVKIEIR
jgi:hypothetical protein